MLFTLDTGNTWSVLLFIIIGVVVMMIGFVIAYKLYLGKFLGKWLNSTLVNIPLIGNWMTGTEGFELNDNVAGARANLFSDRPTTGTRTAKAYGHGRECIWQPGICNPWPKFKNILDETTETQRIAVEDENRAIKFRKLQDPIKRKVFARSPQLSNMTASSIFNQQKNMNANIKSIIGPVPKNDNIMMPPINEIGSQ